MNKENLSKNASELGRQVQEYDSYRVVRGLVRMTPHEEVELLLAGFLGMPSIILVLFGLIWALQGGLIPIYEILVLASISIGLILGVISLRKLFSLKEKIFRGWSTLFFLNTEWVYASPNRNYLIAALLAYMGAYITGALAFISFIDRIPVSPLILTLLTVLFTFLCGLALNHVRKKDQLSELSS